MAPQHSIPLSATILGTIGTIFWCVQLLPQIWHNHRHKSTEGLPGIMMFLWALSGVPTGVYTVVQNFNLPLQVQPQIFMVLTLICWAQTLVYQNRWSTLKTALTGSATALLFAVIELALILGLRGLYARGINSPVLVVGVIAAILLALGIVPPYFEIAKRNGRVVGINFWFLAIDWLGAFFNLMALVAQNTFDVLGGVMFIVVLVLESGIFLSHVIWMVRTRRQRKGEKRGGQAAEVGRPEIEKGIKEGRIPRPGMTTAGPLPDLEKGQFDGEISSRGSAQS